MPRPLLVRRSATRLPALLVVGIAAFAVACSGSQFKAKDPKKIETRTEREEQKEKQDKKAADSTAKKPADTAPQVLPGANNVDSAGAQPQPLPVDQGSSMPPPNIPVMIPVPVPVQVGSQQPIAPGRPPPARRRVCTARPRHGSSSCRRAAPAP